LEENEADFHEACTIRFFGTKEPPELDYTSDQMHELAQKIVASHTVVTGVQPKLSLGLNKASNVAKPSKLTIMGVWGGFILKPQSGYYPHLPELEDLTMHLAQIAGLSTVSHTLIRLKSGELAYLTKRIDREGKYKRHMEDMCQLTERLTEAKYRGSYEQIAKAIIKYSMNPLFDIITFFEQVICSFLTGNSDMHLKNFSLFKDPKQGYVLSPAYDLVATGLVVEGDDEEMALTLNGKKRKLRYTDFERAMQSHKINNKAIENIFKRFQKALPKWHAFIDISFLPDDMKADFQTMLDIRFKQIGLIS
jgi:serine/threonine-protein kinase HipA